MRGMDGVAKPWPLCTRKNTPGTNHYSTCECRHYQAAVCRQLSWQEWLDIWPFGSLLGTGERALMSPLQRCPPSPPSPTHPHHHHHHNYPTPTTHPPTHPPPPLHTCVRAPHMDGAKREPWVFCNMSGTASRGRRKVQWGWISG